MMKEEEKRKGRDQHRHFQFLSSFSGDLAQLGLHIGNYTETLKSIPVLDLILGDFNLIVMECHLGTRSLKSTPLKIFQQSSQL